MRLAGPSQNPETDKPNDRANELPHLKRSYHGLLAERPPFNDDPKKCTTPASAWFLEREKLHMEVPAKLQLENLESHIAPKHKSRFAAIWTKVKEMKTNWKRSTQALQIKWQNVPSTPREDSETSDGPAILQGVYHYAALQAVTSPDQEWVLTLLDQWKEEEKGLRNTFYHADRNYLLLLRYYYEMLLHTPNMEDPDEMHDEPVLALDDPIRSEIQFQNNMLHVIDATHQAVAIAKTNHHNQKKKRLRKGSNEAFSMHPITTMGAYILDTIPYFIHKDKPDWNPVVGILAAALHDSWEDTNLTFQDIKATTSRLADGLDTGIIQDIEYIYGPKNSPHHARRKERIKQKHLNLINDDEMEQLLTILKIVSKDIELTYEEKNLALEQNIAGHKRTQRLLGYPDQAETAERASTSKKSTNSPASRTFKKFPTPQKNTINREEADAYDHMDMFSIKLNALGRGETTRQALLIKLEDRAHNISTMENLSNSYKSKTLRTTVTRLIAWAMEDFDQKKYPLYNALPRLIDITLQEYQKFMRKNPVDDKSGKKFIDDADFRNLEYLKACRDKVKRY